MVFVGDLLVGVVRTVDANWDGRVLEATPAEYLLGDSSFLQLLKDAGYSLPPPHRTALLAAYKVISAEAVDAARLVLDRRHLSRAPPTDERELLLTERRATDLVGRDRDLADLDTWLAAARPITCRCLVARAGTGKTRLAIEFCERAERAGWVAGFARHEELQRFFGQQDLADWRWNEKTLVVVDYAAASAAELRKWLEVLARRPPCDKPLRLLLLERHADLEAGWWAELARPGGLSGPGPDALLDPAQPIVLPSLRRVEERRALLAQAMREAARVRGMAFAPTLPAPDADAEFERRLADDAINNEPLYLLMAGLVAVSTGAPTALTFSRIDLALRVAEAERDRLDRLAAAAGIDKGLFRHLIACVTLQGGCDETAATRLVEEERAAIGDRTVVRTDNFVAHLATALPLPGSNDVDAVRPDLIGEALLWQHLTDNRRRLAEQCAIVERAFVRAGRSVVTTVVHAAQDLAQGDAAHATVAWLDRLASRARDVSALMAIADELPQHTLALRERATEITTRIVDALRASVASEPDRLSDLASSLNNLSNRLSELGRREEALAASEEAVATYRALAASRPDAFRPDLALSLWVLADRIDENGDPPGGVGANAEAIAVLAVPFQQLPTAHAPRMAGMLQEYIQRCQKLEREPDMELLTPVLSVFELLQRNQGSDR